MRKYAMTMKRSLLITALSIALVGPTAAGQTTSAHTFDCDTTHTSDLRAVLRCGKVCVHLRGPSHSRSLEVDNFDQGDDGGGRFSFKLEKGIATLNGKRCKVLPQTYDYN
jgi:hypothetical protein